MIDEKYSLHMTEKELRSEIATIQIRLREQNATEVDTRRMRELKMSLKAIERAKGIGGFWS